MPLLLTVKTVLPLLVRETGLKLGTTPEGRPVVLNWTVPLNPLCRVNVPVYVVLAPAAIVWLAGVEVKVKFLTVSETLAVCVKPPSVELTVTV